MTRSQLFSPSFLLRSTFWMRKSHWEKSRKEAVFIALHIFLIPSSQCFVMIIPLSTGQRVSSTFSDYSTASHFLWNEQVARHVHHVKASQAPIFMIYYQPSCRLSLVCFTYMSHNLLFKQSFSRNARPGTSYYYYFFSVWSIFPPLFWLQTHEYFQTQSECQPSELLTLHLAVGNKASILLPPLQSLACNCQKCALNSYYRSSLDDVHLPHEAVPPALKEQVSFIPTPHSGPGEHILQQEMLSKCLLKNSLTHCPIPPSRMYLQKSDDRDTVTQSLHQRGQPLSAGGTRFREGRKLSTGICLLLRF